MGMVDCVCSTVSKSLVITLLRARIPGLPSFGVTVTKRDELDELVAWEPLAVGLAKRKPAALRGHLTLSVAGAGEEVLVRLVINFDVSSRTYLKRFV